MSITSGFKVYGNMETSWFDELSKQRVIKPLEISTSVQLYTLNAKILSLESLVNGLVKSNTENKEMIEYLKDMLEEEFRSKV